MNPIKMILYGEPGIGKTVLAVSVVDVKDMMPAILLDFEGGTMSVESKVTPVTLDSLRVSVLKEAKMPKDKVCAIRIKEWADLADVIDILWEDKDGVVKTVVIDSLSEISYLNMNTIVKNEAAKDRNRDPSMYQLQDYNKNAVQMRMMVREFRDLPINVIFTCHADTQKDETTGRISILPSLVGRKVPKEVGGLVDVIGYMIVNRDGDREAMFQPTNTVTAKDRTEGGKLGDSMINPTMSDIWNARKGK